MLRGKATRDMVYFFLKRGMVSSAEDMGGYDSDSDDTKCKPQLWGGGRGLPHLLTSKKSRVTEQSNRNGFPRSHSVGFSLSTQPPPLPRITLSGRLLSEPISGPLTGLAEIDSTAPNWRLGRSPSYC